jgi:hypothetical protein
MPPATASKREPHISCSPCGACDGRVKRRSSAEDFGDVAYYLIHPMAVTERHRSTIAFTLIGTLAFLFVCIPELIFGFRFPGLSPAYMFAGDAFYYFDIVRNSRLTSFATFDGRFATNGFHPLWEFLLSALTRWHVLDFQHPLHVLDQIFGLQVILLSVASGLFCAFAAKHLARRWLALFIIAPGALWFPMALMEPGYLSVWSNLNGMECCLELLMFAGAVVLYRQKSDDWKTVVFELFLGLTVLARLDDIFYLLAFAGLATLYAPADRRLKVVLGYAPAFVLILAYMMYSKWAAGTFLPASGAAKAGLSFVSNGKSLVKLFVPGASWDRPRGLTTPLVGYSEFAELGMRVLQMVLPLFICGVELIYRWRKSRCLANVVSVLCLGTCLKCLYNFCFVALGHQGFWYYAVPVFVANFVVVIWLDRLLVKLLTVSQTNVPRVVLFAGQACLAMLCFNILINHKLNETGRLSLRQRLVNHALVRTSILDQGQDSFVEFTDGEIGYESGLRSVAGLGLALDREAFVAVKGGKLFSLLQLRGYELFVATDTYGEAIDSYLDSKAWNRGIGLWELKPSEFLAHPVEKVFYEKSLGLHIYRMK